MNVGGRWIKNPELCGVFEGMGYASVSAFLASGNVVFESKDGVAMSVASVVEAGLRDALGYEVPVFCGRRMRLGGLREHGAFAGFCG